MIGASVDPRGASFLRHLSPRDRRGEAIIHLREIGKGVSNAPFGRFLRQFRSLEPQMLPVLIDQLGGCPEVSCCNVQGRT